MCQEGDLLHSGAPVSQGPAQHDIASSRDSFPCNDLFRPLWSRIRAKALLSSADSMRHPALLQRSHGFLVELFQQHLLSLGMLRPVCPGHVPADPDCESISVGLSLHQLPQPAEPCGQGLPGRAVAHGTAPATCCRDAGNQSMGQA